MDKFIVVITKLIRERRSRLAYESSVHWCYCDYSCHCISYGIVNALAGVEVLVGGATDVAAAAAIAMAVVISVVVAGADAAAIFCD